MSVQSLAINSIVVAVAADGGLSHGQIPQTPQTPHILLFPSHRTISVSADKNPVTN